MVTYIDRHSPVYLNGETYPSTVRSVKCDMLIHGGKCKTFSLYHQTLRVLHGRWCQHDELSS